MLPIGGIFPPFFDLPPTYLRKGEEAKKENDTFFPIYECQRPKNDLVSIRPYVVHKQAFWPGGGHNLDDL